MIRLLRDFRVLPIVLFATICLLTLKILGLAFGGGYTLGGFAARDADDADVTATIAAPRRADAPAPERPAQPSRLRSWAQQMFNYPDVTGAVGENNPPQPDNGPPKADRSGAKPSDPPAANAGWTPLPLERPPSAAERAILERLQERRAELEARARELDMRESLIKAAEKRIEGRLAELKDLEARINSVLQLKDEEEVTRFKNVVTMYENMKAKDAAKIFDRLDLRILVEVATQINPRRMSDILALMVPEAAERLTVELAARKDKGQPPELPKIEGRPTSN